MKKGLPIALVITVVAGCIWILLRHVEHRQPDNNARFSVTSSLPNADAVAQAMPVASLTNREAGLKKPEGLSERDWQILLQVRRQLLNDNKPIEFHARVIDQFHQPVSGAVVEGRLFRNDEEKLSPANFLRFKPGDEIVRETLELISDNDGWIRLTRRRGQFIVIESLACSGYVWRFEKFQNFHYDRPNLSEDFKDRTKGHIFQVWKKGETEKLIPFHFAVPVDLEGTNWYGVDFFRGVISDGKTGDFRFWFLTTTDVNGQPARRFRFEAPDGGLQLDAKPYPYEAPADGYAPGQDWMYEPFGQHAKGNHSETLVRRFYVRGRGGKIYASVTWNFIASAISGYINPAGSRNLDPDPAKQITDPDEIRRLDEATRDK